MELQERVLENWKAFHEAIARRDNTIVNKTYRKLHKAGPWEKYYTLKVMKSLDSDAYFDTVFLCTEDIEISKRGKPIAMEVLASIIDYWKKEAGTPEFHNMGQIEEYKEMYKSFKHSLIKDSI